MMSKATWKAKILLIQLYFDPIFLYCAHNLLRSHNFQVLIPLQGLFLYLELLRRFLVQYMPLYGHLVHHIPHHGAFFLSYASIGAFCLSCTTSGVSILLCVILF